MKALKSFSRDLVQRGFQIQGSAINAEEAALFWTDQLILFQPVEAHYAHHITPLGP